MVTFFASHIPDEFEAFKIKGDFDLSLLCMQVHLFETYVRRGRTMVQKFSNCEVKAKNEICKLKLKYNLKIQESICHSILDEIKFCISKMANFTILETLNFES